MKSCTHEKSPNKTSSEICLVMLEQQFNIKEGRTTWNSDTVVRIEFSPVLREVF